MGERKSVFHKYSSASEICVRISSFYCLSLLRLSDLRNDDPFCIDGFDDSPPPDVADALVVLLFGDILPFSS